MREETPVGFHILLWQTDWGGHIVLAGEAQPADTTELIRVLPADLLPSGKGVSIDSRNLMMPSSELVLQEALARLAEHIPIISTIGSTFNRTGPPVWQMHSYNLRPARWTSSFARSQAESLAKSLGLAEQDVEGIRIAVGEAVTNAVRHGCNWRPQNKVGFKCTADPNRIEIEISDCGPGFDFKSAQLMKRPSSDGGHGLSIIQRLMDECHISCDGGTTVRLIKHVRKQEK